MAGVAARYMLYASTSDDSENIRRHRHLTAFNMEMGMPGFTVERINEIIGFDNIQDGVLNLDEVPVHVENRIGEEGEGWQAMLEGVNVERTLLAAQAAASLGLIVRGLVIILFLIFDPGGSFTGGR